MSGLTKYGDWALWKTLLTSSRFKSAMESEMAKAIVNSLNAIRKKIIGDIDDKAYVANAPLTIILKGSSTPLVDRGDLRRTIQIRKISWQEGLVGVLRNGQQANIAMMLHEGATIRVTPKMRGHFENMAKLGRGVHPLNPGTTQIRIPGRPFIRAVVESSQVEDLVQTNWANAVDAALNDKQGNYKSSL